MSKVKIIFLVLGIAILTGGIFTGTLLVQKNQKLRSKAAPATTLSISPSTQNKLREGIFTQNVIMNTGVNQITGVQFEIRFNPQAIEIVSIQKGSGIASLDQQIKNSIDNTTGKISYAVYTLSINRAINGQNIQALTINGKVKSLAGVGSYSTTFDATTALSGVLEEQNVLTGTTPGSIVVYKKGDVNNNGVVDIVDIGIVLDNFDSSPPTDPRANLNGDNVVNIVDIGIVIDNFE